MKKWFFVAFVAASVMAACNGGNKTSSDDPSATNYGGTDSYKTENGDKSNGDKKEGTDTKENDDIDPDVINNPNTIKEDKNGTGKYPVMTFEKTSHNFGKITQGEVVEYEFRFKNTGDADLIITNAKSTCGCTVPDWPKQPIRPGESGNIKVKFSSEGKDPGQTIKPITITANTNPNQNELSIE